MEFSTFAEVTESSMTKENLWFENLPDKCPPADAYPCHGCYFRIIKGDKPEESDFLSQRSIQPTAIFSGVDECVARSLSVFDNMEQALLRLKIPKFRNCKVWKLELNELDGKIKKTFGPAHYSWWRAKEFDVNCI